MSTLRQAQVANSERFILFSLGKEFYALPLFKVKEVIASVSTRPLPGAPAHVKGVMDLRGRVITIVDLRLRLGMPAVKDLQQSTTIILDIEGLDIGVTVDHVESVLSVSQEEMKPPPVEATNGQIAGIVQNKDQLVVILNIDTLIQKK